MRKLIPHGFGLVIKAPKQKEGGALELHRSSQERPLIGIVLAVGENVRFYKVGDEVAYTRFNINEFDLDGETYFVMEESQVLAAVREEE